LSIVTHLTLSGEADLLSVRFARSPIWEAQSAVMALVGAEPQPHHASWLASVRNDIAALELAPLVAVGVSTRWVPDFITPPPSGPTPTFGEQLAQIQSTPLDQVAAELARCRAAARSDASIPLLDELVADPARARQVLAAALERAWDALVAPHWLRISALVDSDVAYRSRRLARAGLGSMLDSLHPRIRLSGLTVVIDDASDERIAVAGRGLVLMPSAYVWPSVVAIIEPPWQPTIVYPARGIADLWRDPLLPSKALARLVGETRAVVLGSLDEPVSTTTLAARLGRSASGVSGHLLALRAAGLVRSSRHGHELRYARTALGSAVLRGSDSVTLSQP
jgi:DNA-binding transcriptional ArsR family regulator